MRVDAFDFDLPNERIALRPARPRDAARMLVVEGTGARLTDRHVRDLPALLSPGDVLVFAVSTFHASFGGAAGRRQGVMVYYEDPQQPVATEAIVRQMQGNHSIFSRHRQQMYPKYWRELAKKDARRGMWMARMAELGVLETPIPADDDQNAARL